jgi:hypothetical protein
MFLGAPCLAPAGVGHDFGAVLATRTGDGVVPRPVSVDGVANSKRVRYPVDSDVVGVDPTVLLGSSHVFLDRCGPRHRRAGLDVDHFDPNFPFVYILASQQ